MRYLTVEQYLFFRDIGLFGLGLDGRRDPSFGGEHALRNKLFADLLVTTGLRLQEASSLTRVELPGPSAGAASLPIAGPTAKRSKPRDVLVPARVLDNLRFYVRSARAEIVERAIRAGRLPGPEDVTVSVRGRRVMASDGTLDADLAVVGPDLRRQLIELGDGIADPLVLFVGRSSRAVRPQAWERVFEAATQRCAGFAGRPGVPTIGRVTPHMLRHTFAVHTLSALLTEQLQRGQDESPRRHPGTMALRQVAENPLRRLQRLLGHSQVATTYAYLDCLDEASELVEAAMARWDMDASWADVVGIAGR
jgi:integrase